MYREMALAKRMSPGEGMTDLWPTLTGEAIGLLCHVVSYFSQSHQGIVLQLLVQRAHKS